MEGNDFPANHDIKCYICGENRFEEREGFYYCKECGTKQEQVRLVEVECNDEFDPEKVLKAKRQKIEVTKEEKPALTSWECYNYILRGFVEDLLSLGAKEELKLMALQVWAAYLRRMEVAFFNRKQPDLPKLCVKYLQNDAKTIYNHSRETFKRRKQKRSEDTSCTSGGDSKSSKSWRRSKQKLDESNYSLTSGTSRGSGLTSTTSANSNRAIKMGFSSKARAYYKRKMPKKHLEKHASDGEGILKCHKQPKAREIKRTYYNLMLVNIKQVYSILAIALNLIGDKIQLSDLIRFINEGHIGTSNVLEYFPENIANNGKEILKKIHFYKYPEKYSDKALRDHISTMCKNIGINTPKKPDIIKLVRRYVKELYLPAHFSDYIERLINLLPPKFKTRAVGYYPGFEARAMAYIIFTLKLFYGLDDNKEHRISQASQKLNSKIKLLNHRNQEKQPLLFVWNEWVEYIEMRKVIVSQFNTSFCTQFKQCQSTDQVLEKMTEEMRSTEETDNLFNDTAENQQIKQKYSNLRSILERFKETYKVSEEEKKPTLKITFEPSFTPAYSYLKKILLLCDNETNTNCTMNIKIPDFMFIDHSQRDINSFIQVKPLITYFKCHQIKLNVHVLPTNPNKQYIGIFRPPRSQTRTSYNLYKACFKVTEEEWSKMIMSGPAQSTDDLEFITNLNTYPKNYNVRRNLELKRKACFNLHMNYNFSAIQDDADVKIDNERIPKRYRPNNVSNPCIKNLSLNHLNEDLKTNYSFELFSENNMEPIDSQNFITEPRRNLENNDIFAEISDEESVLNSESQNSTNLDDFENNIVSEKESLLSSVELDTSSIGLRSATPSTLEEFVKTELVSPKQINVETPKKINVKSNKSTDDLKMYISNMDCWMILGNILMITKAQRAQLQDKFPRSFNWLLETCAQTINVEWSAVFEQLLCIETMFCLGINDPTTIKNCVYINSHHPIKEIQMILSTYREIW